MGKKEYSQKDIEKIIKDSEESFRTLFDSTFEGIIIYEKGVVLDVNKTAVSLFGYEREEAIGLKILDVIAEECREDIQQKMAEVIKNPHIILGPYETIGLGKNGKKFNVEVYSKSFNYEGRIVRLVAFRDITKRKIDEEKLKQSEIQFREFVEGTNDLITRVDNKGRFIYVNQAAKKIFGIHMFECIGRSAFDFVHPDDREMTKKSFNKWISERASSVTFENRQVSKNGDVFNMLWSINLHYDEKGNITRINSIARDITAREQAEKALLESEESFRTLFDSTFEGIFIYDKGVILEGNKTMASMLGYERNELTGLKVLDIVAEESHDDIRQKLSSVSEDPFIILGPYETMSIKKDGTTFNVEVYSKGLNYKGKVVRLVSFRDITERKIAEEKLKQSEKQFRSIYDATFEGIVIYEKDIILDANKTAALIFRYEQKELIGLNILDIIAEESRDLIRQKIASAAKNPHIVFGPYEATALGKNGMTFPVEVYSKSFNYNGRAARLVSFSDITERKKAEEALRESEEKYRALFEASADGIVIADIETKNFKYANQALCRMLGYNEEELQSMGVSDIHPKESLEHVISEFEAQARGEKTLAEDIPCLRKDGSIIYTDINTAIALIDGKKCNIGFFRDITERKKAEEALLKSEERLELALVGGDLGLWDWNVKTGDCYFGRRWVEMLGYKPGEIEPHYKSWEKILHPDDKPEVLKKLNSHFEDGTVLYEVEMRLLTKSGKWKWILGKGKVVERDENGAPLRMTGTHLDITERKKMEELRLEREQRLRKMNDVLVSIAKHKTVVSGDLEAASSEITETAVNTLEVEHSSIWFLNEEDGSSQCFDSFQRSTGEHTKGLEIRGSDKESSRFIGIIEKSRIFAVNDIKSDPFIKAFYEQYFPDAGTTSTIWTPIRRHGKTIGILSIDHEGTPREWTIEEQNFAGSLVDVIRIAIESSERIDAEKVLENKISFQNLIAQISTEFINLSPIDFDIGINNVLQKIGEFAGADRSYVFVFKDNNTKMDNTHEWCTEGIEPQVEDLKDIDSESIPWWMEKLNRFETVHIPSVEELPEEAKAEKEILQAQNIKSLVVVPLKYHNILYGFIGFDSVRMAKYWFYDSIRLLETVGTTITKALEHKRIHEELRKINEELEKKVEERTRELREKQAQLVQSEKMASLGNLVAGVAHEINTPLGALISNNDIFIRSIERIKSLLEDRIVSSKTPKDINLAKIISNIEKLNEVSDTAADRITKIVKSLRSFARLDQAEMDTVDIHGGIESTLTLVHHEIKRRIQVHKDYGEIPKISCYPNQLNQVFMNILINASQAIEKKGDIYIKTYVHDSKAIIEIRDTGRGISKENLKRIFDPGFTTKSRGVGSGLGLSIVYQIIQDHKGEIEVESEFGKGTTFRIILPI